MPTLSALSIGSLTLSPAFDPQRTEYFAPVAQAGNVSDEYRITAGTRSGQTVAYSLGSGTTAKLRASITSNGVVRIGDGSLSEGDTGVVIIKMKVTEGNASTTYRITLNVTITAHEFVDVDIPGD